MARPRVALSLAMTTGVIVVAGIAFSGTSVAAQSTSALSRVCKSLQAKAIAAEAADPSGHGDTQEQAAYRKRCPDADPIYVVSLGSLSSWDRYLDGRGKPAGITKVTSSRPSVVALGKPTKTGSGGSSSVMTIVQAIGRGTSRVCFTTTDRHTDCLLFAVPPSVAGKGGGRTLNVAFGNQAGAAATVVSITSSDPSVVSVATDPSSSLPYVVLSGPGTTTICAKYTKGRGGCQQWTIAP